MPDAGRLWSFSKISTLTKIYCASSNILMKYSGHHSSVRRVQIGPINNLTMSVKIRNVTIEFLYKSSRLQAHPWHFLINNEILFRELSLLYLYNVVRRKSWKAWCEYSQTLCYIGSFPIFASTRSALIGYNIVVSM